MNHPFDIDRAVRTWRSFLESQGSFTSEDLDELESHLWEEIERRRRPDISDEQVFHAALREVGDFAELESTFRGVRFEKMWRQESRLDSLRAGLDLTANHLLLAWRSLIRNPGLNLINITGLAVGIAVCALIFLFIKHERSYDTFHEKAERTYRIQAHNGSLATSALLAPTLAAEFPAVETAVRLSQRYFEVKVLRGDESFFDDGFLFVDSTFFEMFDFRLISGNPATALTAPFDLVITQSVAEQYFGSEDPVGRILRIEGNWDAHDYTVTGVVEDPPSNTHLDFRFLTAFDTRYSVEPSPENIDSWFHVGDHTYVTLTPSASADSLHARMPDLYQRVRERPLPDGVDDKPLWKPQPVTAIHHGPVYERQIKPVSDPQYLYVFGAVGLIVLLIGSFNYVNLVTARSVSRAREIGIRKVAGARRMQLIRQLITETTLTSGIAVVAGIALVRFGLPLLDRMVGAELDVVAFGSLDFWGFVLGVWVAITLLAGIYPAFVISGVKPARVVKGLVTSDRSNARLRHALVVVQFTASAILIVGTLFVRGQLNYMQSTNLGLYTEQVIVVETGGLLGSERDDVFKAEVGRHPDVVGVSAMTSPFPLSNDDLRMQIYPERPTRDHRPTSASMISVDAGFIETMGLSVIEGRAFQEGDAERGKSISPVILNEEAVRVLGWDDPIGRTFECCVRPTPTVVGVVEDFHFQSLKEPIKPLALNPSWWSRTILVRTTAAGVPGVVDHLEGHWAEFGEGTPLNWYFLDDNFEAAYDAEQRLARSFGFFASLAVFIACLGLLGLAAFMVQRRTHEIGVRKVLGATARSIVALLTRDFLKWVVAALVIGVPIAYWLGLKWLESFPYRAPLGTGWIAAAVAGILLIAGATVASQSVGAAMRNPAETLRHE